MMKYYPNPQMLSPEELHEVHLEMAKKYLESKWDGYYYELDTVTEEPVNTDVEFYEDEGNWLKSFQIDDSYPARYSQEGIQYVKLSSEQRSQIQKRIDESGEKLLYKALKDDPELMKLILVEYEIGEGEYYDQYYGYASKIGDIPCQTCNITVCTIDQTGKTQVFPYDIMLTKDEYLKLLVIVMDHRWVTFNDLHEYDLDLYKKISEINNSEATSISESDNKLSYTLVFTEIEKDVHELLGEGDVVVELCNFNEEYDGDRIACVSVQFSEKRMVVLHNYIFPFEDVTEVLFNIDATAVLEALNVNSYRDAANILKDRFYGINACNNIKAFLKRNKIAYDYHTDCFEYDEQGNPLI